MTWSLFKTRSQRQDSPASTKAASRQNIVPYPRVSSQRCNSSSAAVNLAVALGPSDTRRVLDPEPIPLKHYYIPPSPASRMSPSVSENGKGKRTSMHSLAGSRCDSVRSYKSGSASIRSRQLRAAHAARRAAAQYMAANREKSLLCYTCGHQITEIRCQVCRTAYLPPEFQFSASSAAILNGSDPWGSDYGHENWLSGASTYQPNLTTKNASEAAGCGNTAAASFIGFYNEGDDDCFEKPSRLDLELVIDLATLNESTLLEAVLFEGFSHVDSIADTFFHFGDNASLGQVPQNGTPIDYSTASLDRFAAKRLPNDFNVQKLYDLLTTVSSTGPMRGILRGAQFVLQTRRHAPITEKELAFICVVLQCPAITDCSMFTKISGPLQKLSKYTSLRSRARIILESCAGLLVHSSEELHPIFSRVFALVSEDMFAGLVDLCNSYISHRLIFDYHCNSKTTSSPNKFRRIRHDWYADDWRLSAVAKLLSLLWEANRLRSLDKANGRLHLDRFYNSMVDRVDLKADFDFWQQGKSRKYPRFCFCNYPYLLSMGSKAIVFEHGVQRIVNSVIQRELFSMLATSRSTSSLESERIHMESLKIFTLSVRRQHLFEDSVAKLKDWHTHQRRAFKVEFQGEPGIDAGGLKREWFSMFYKHLFDPNLGVFVMDSTSNYCWFGKNADSDLCRVAGIALGLALFNSVTVDLNLPLLLFKLLLGFDYDLKDVATLWPEIAQSLQNILTYDSEDFEEVFGLTFSAPDGTELIANGDSMNVTLASKETYVQLLVENLLNVDGTAFCAFKDGFLAVCGDNAVNLFQPEELELLTRGDRKPIDVPALRSVTKYVNFGHRYEKANAEPVVQWFWDFFGKLDPESQARLLQFVTATDRLPAAGMVQMRFSIYCLGGDSERLPISHTCFNQLCLYRYKSRRKLETKLSLAISEYQGFGLK